MERNNYDINTFLYQYQESTQMFNIFAQNINAFYPSIRVK